MKKISLLAGMLFSTFLSDAQTQRLVLAEEFTQASCGPCAAQNPAFNALLSANTGKVVALKYQTNWPGTDPMNAQNPGDVSTRGAGISSVPSARLDGGIVGGGSPSYITQASIDNRYAVPSPFVMSLSHSFSPDYDSIFISCTITASQAFSTSGLFKAHIAMIERHIHFTSSPGTNGEKDFYNVMRKMYPSAYGTSLPLNWTTGQSQTVTVAAPVPSYIYDKGEIGIVAFVQNDNDRVVHQAAYSEPQPFTIDAGTAAIATLPLYQCTGVFGPSVAIKNYGATVLTSCTVNYKIDSGIPAAYVWTGTLDPDSIATITLPAVPVTPGAHVLTVYTSGANGLISADADPSNNQLIKTFAIVDPLGQAAPFTEDFEAITFPPAGWFLNNPDGSTTWTRKSGIGGFGGSSACAKMDFWSSANGQTDELYSESIDLSGAAGANLSFSVAYAQYMDEDDRIEVKASADCGTTWTTVYNKAGSALATAPPATGMGGYTPSDSEWRTETVDLAPFIGHPNLMLKFVGTSNYGNNAYIDDINLTGDMATGITDQAGNFPVTVSPNPMSDQATISFDLPQAAPVKIILMNTLGQTVLDMEPRMYNPGNQSCVLSTTDLSNGLYILNIQLSSKTISKKIMISR